MTTWQKIKESEAFIVTLFLTGVLGFIFCVIVGANACDENACKRLGEQTGVETKYDTWSHCYVKIRGRWVPRDSWREVPE